ncbi:MAG TPA: class I SAM-dependent methyltransferase [Gaiellaceae bacterium]
MERYVIRGGREGYERLRLLARVRWPDTSELLARAGVGPGMRCLDLGCGGGAVTLELARLVGPQGSVTGIDMDEVKLSLGRAAAAERGLDRVEFRHVDVNDWDEPGRYDLVYSRFLLQHLSRPADLVRRMWAAVRPGGVLVAEDADFGALFCEPRNEGYEFFERIYPRLLDANGGDWSTPRKLFGYFLAAGAPTPALRFVQGVASAGDGKLLVLTTLEFIADAIVAVGLATEDEVSAACASLAAFAADESTLASEPRVFQLWSRRPAVVR